MPINYGSPIQVNPDTYNNVYNPLADSSTATGTGYNHAAGTQAELGGTHGLASSLANQYGQQAAMMGGQQLSNRWSGQDTGVVADSRAQQQAALDYQRQLAMGDPNSPAQQQLRSGLSAAIAGQQSTANSTIGGGAAQAFAQRNAAFNSAGIAGQGRNDAAALQASEMAAARNRYTEGANDMRNQDQSLQNLGQQRDLGQAALQQGGQLASQGLSNSILGAQLGSDSNAYNTRSQANSSSKVAAAQQDAADKEARDRMIAAGVGTAATVGAAIAF